ncbi:hypothetical protein GA0070215_101417 [Micromonospora marina]|uniref:Prenyltransferase and squalene oxidase repeat-containing protein n=1 Tax=Micromonospora marina TaxID=307120 RepID=A0A1C4UDL8_9ACTN|nr:hypothetical protein GA0070215_101417 [Micromonospora marina]
MGPPGVPGGPIVLSGAPGVGIRRSRRPLGRVVLTELPRRDVGRASTVSAVVDLDAAIGFVVAHGDAVDRARLSRLRSGAPVPPDVLDAAEAGQAPGGGWPAVLDGDVASIDATCFRLAELDDLGALGRPAARHALDWLAARQLPDGGWDEDPSLAGLAPEWATPGDPEARLYQTANAGFWLTVAGLDARAAGPLDHRVGGAYAGVVQAAAQALAAQLAPDGSWPSFLPAGWLAAAVLHRQQMYYESARIQAVLADRVPQMSPADVAWLAATLRRADVGEEQWLLVSARRRLAETQRSDGGWDSDDGHQFDVHTTLRAIRACRPNTPEAPVSGAPFVVPQTAELPAPPAIPAPRRLPASPPSASPAPPVSSPPSSAPVSPPSAPVSPPSRSVSALPAPVSAPGSAEPAPAPAPSAAPAPAPALPLPTFASPALARPLTGPAGGSAASAGFGSDPSVRRGPELSSGRGPESSAGFGPDLPSGPGPGPSTGPVAAPALSAGPDGGPGPWSDWIVTPGLLPEEGTGIAARSVPDLPPGPVMPGLPPVVATPRAAPVSPGTPPLATPPPAPMAPTIASSLQPGTTPPVDPAEPADGGPLQLA